MLSIHPNARTTPAVRAEIARSQRAHRRAGQRYGVSPPRPSASGASAGPADCQDRSAGRTSCPGRRARRSAPSSAPCAAPPASRSTTSPSSSRHFLPHLNRDDVYRILKAEGLSRLPPADRTRKPARRVQGVRARLRAHGREAPAQAADRDGEMPQALPVRRHRPRLALRAPGGQGRRDRPPRPWPSSTEALAALPFRVTHVLTDRGSCFTADGFENACEQHGVEHRKTKPYTPRTNGMVERFNGRVQREVLGITIYSHRDLETVLAGFNRAYNARRQRVLKGRSPDMVVRERLAAKPELANNRTKPPDPRALPKALQVIARAKEVSHPDN